MSTHTTSPTASTPVSAIRRPRRAWRWALGSLLAVALVLTGAYAARRSIANSHHAPTVAAPTTPLLRVSAIADPQLSYQLIALDAAAGRLVALAADAQPVCPPPTVGECPPAPALTRLVILDAQTGALLAGAPLTGAASVAATATRLIADPARGVVYAITPQRVVIFSTRSASYITSYALPLAPIADAAFDPQTGALFLSGSGAFLALDAASGKTLAHTTLDASLTNDPALLFSAAGPLGPVIYTLARSAAGAATPQLTFLDARTLAPLGRASLPAGMRLGPRDLQGQQYICAADGSIASAPLAQLERLAAAHSADAAPPSAAPLLVAQPALVGAQALGWNADASRIVSADAVGLAVRAADTGHTLAALPLRLATGRSDQALPIYTPPAGAASALALLTSHGQLLIATDATDSATNGGATRASDASTEAALLAQTALSHFLPDTNQDPPFVSAADFPLTTADASRAMRFWIHYSDFRGWQGPLDGATATSVRPVPHTASYDVRFTIIWYEQFQRTYTWVCRVAPDGSVRLQSEQGDVIP